MKALFKFGALVVVATFLIVGTTSAAEVIVPSPFTSSAYDGWSDTFEGMSAFSADDRGMKAYPPKWGILLGNDLLLEDSGGFVGGTEAEGMGSFHSFNLINNSAAGALPATYTLGGTFSAFDNDGLGLIFGYQDENNFFRVSSHSSDSLETYYPKGIAVQKCINGVYTPLANDDTQDHLDDGTEFSLSVAVTNDSYEVFYNGSSIVTGTDADLTSRGGDYGVYSYGQDADDWGVQMRDVTLSSSTINHTHTFTNTGAVEWAEYTMYNSFDNDINHKTNPSDFRLDFRNNTIRQDANNSISATDTAPATDFVAPTVAIVDSESSTWTDYEMWVRLANDDDDGIGLMVRVSDDSFYRINFCLGDTDGTRPPKGMSIQKCHDYTYWSQLFADDQVTPLFTYTPRMVDGEDYTNGIPFDVKVTIEDTNDGRVGITVQVIDDPDGVATVIDYPIVYDDDSPLTSGGVAFTAWASGGTDSGGRPAMESIFSGYGGDEDAPLITEIGYIPVVDDIPGDANSDGKVDGSDVTILANNWQAGVPGGDLTVTWSMGDFNGDHMVDGSDVTILANNWQYGIEAAAAAVPEPSTIVLLLGAIGTLLVIRRRK